MSWLYTIKNFADRPFFIMQEVNDLRKWMRDKFENIIHVQLCCRKTSLVLPNLIFLPHIIFLPPLYTSWTCFKSSTLQDAHQNLFRRSCQFILCIVEDISYFLFKYHRSVPLTHYIASRFSRHLFAIWFWSAFHR